MPTVFLEFLGYGYSALLLFLTTEVLSYSSGRELYFLNGFLNFFLPLFRKVAQNRRAQNPPHMPPRLPMGSAGPALLGREMVSSVKLNPAQQHQHSRTPTTFI